MHKILAIVVTFNRAERLRACLDALDRQTERVFDVLVVDNASEDGTGAFLEERTSDGFFVLTEEKNVGGAGGFHDGLRWGMKNDYEYFWLMDDDVICSENALKELLRADKNLGGDYGFLSSLALYTDGSVCVMNNCLLKGRLTTDNAIFVSGDTYNEVITATFVSFFIKAETVKEVGYPIKEMFLWSDDTEYSSRITKTKRGVFVPQSVVIHAMDRNEKPDLATLDASRIPRMVLNIRNRYYIARRDGFKKKMRFYARHFLLWHRVLFRAKDHKAKRLFAIVKGTLLGWGFRPKPSTDE